MAQGHYAASIGEQLPELKALVKESVGSHVRRIDRFIQLALIGAGRTAQAGLEAGGVYFASGNGDVEITAELLHSIYQRGEPPKPLSFVNSVSNAAGFYIGQTLQLHGPSQFVTSRYFALESALQVAALALVQGRVASALVGAVDGVLLPMSDHRARLSLAPETPVAEASFWLQLCADPGGRPVLATLDRIWNFANVEELQRELPAGALRADANLMFNQFMPEAIRPVCTRHLQKEPLAFESAYGFYCCQTGELLAQFIEGEAEALALVSGDPSGRLQLFEFSKPAR